MRKYIIEIEDVPFSKVRIDADNGAQNINLYRAKGFNALVFDKEGLDKLTPLDMLNKDLKEAYQCGLDDAWKAITKIAKMPDGERGKVFGDCWISNILNKFSAPEIINILDGYEPEQDEIKVGDEVKDRTDDCGVVTWIYGNDTYVLWQDGSTGNYAADELIKTGRHFNFLASLLNAMKEGAE